MEVTHNFVWNLDRNQRVSQLWAKQTTQKTAADSDPSSVLLSHMRADPSQTISHVLQSYLILLGQLRECGARHFLLLNVPPISRTPHFLWDEPDQAESLRKAVVEFNRQLNVKVLEWRITHFDVCSLFFFRLKSTLLSSWYLTVQSTMVLYDAWLFMTKILDNAREYGFEDNVCTGEGCIWWNEFHPTSAFHELLAADLARFLGWTNENSLEPSTGGHYL